MPEQESPIAHGWLQNLSDRIDANHRDVSTKLDHVLTALGEKVDRAEIEPQLASLRKSERAQAVKLAGLAATVSAVVIWLKGVFFGAS